MYKLILLSILLTGFIFANNDNDCSTVKSNNKSNYWLENTFDENFKTDARTRRGGKGQRGRKKGGRGLR